jgi:hypothetical protein
MEMQDHGMPLAVKCGWKSEKSLGILEWLTIESI